MHLRTSDEFYADFERNISENGRRNLQDFCRKISFYKVQKEECQQRKNLSLNLVNCRIGDRGAEALAEFVPAGLGSLTLELGGCAVGSDGVLALAAGLPPGLQSLSLDFARCEVFFLRDLCKYFWVIGLSRSNNRALLFRKGLSMPISGNKLITHYSGLMRECSVATNTEAARGCVGRGDASALLKLNRWRLLKLIKIK